MRTIDDIPMTLWPRPLPLDVTPPLLQLLFLLPVWRFKFRGKWHYVTAAQYHRIFRRRGA